MVKREQMGVCRRVSIALLMSLQSFVTVETGTMVWRLFTATVDFSFWPTMCNIHHSTLGTMTASTPNEITPVQIANGLDCTSDPDVVCLKSDQLRNN